MRAEKVCEAVRATGLFDACQNDDLCFETCAFKRGQEVDDRFRGEPCVGVVVQGQIDVCADERFATTVSTLLPGQMFGICNVLARRPMPTFLKCRKAATVAYLPKERFVSLMMTYPETALAYGTLCNEKIQFLAHRVTLSRRGTAQEKLCAYLYENATDGVVHIASKESLARLLGISRAALFRELGALREQGKITVREKIIFLEEPL